MKKRIQKVGSNHEDNPFSKHEGLSTQTGAFPIHKVFPLGIFAAIFSTQLINSGDDKMSLFKKNVKHSLFFL